MGAIDESTRNDANFREESRSQMFPATEGGAADLVDEFSRLGVDGASFKGGRGLLQVMKAVEAAENIIKQQFEENKYLKAQLEDKSCELEKIKTSGSTLLRSSFGSKDEFASVPQKILRPVSPKDNQADVVTWMDTRSLDPQALDLQQHLMQNTEISSMQRIESYQYPERSKMNGILKALPSGQTDFDHTGFSQFSAPSSRPQSPSRYQMQGESDAILSFSGRGEMQMSEVNFSTSLSKQDLFLKATEQDGESMQLRKHVVELSLKEVQMRNEIYVLEKRIASMRRAFDQQQQDLVDATSKALSYRQEIIEENIRLTYALQAVEQERNTFVSYLLPLLSEYSMELPVSDAQSIASNLKALFKHLQEKLFITEEKLKEHQYRLKPWHTDLLNNTNFNVQPSAVPLGSASNTSKRNIFEIVPQPEYAQAQMSNSSPFNAQPAQSDWESSGKRGLDPLLGNATSKNLDHDDIGRPLVSPSRRFVAQDTRLVATQSESHITSVSEEKNNNRPPSFNEFINSNESDRPDAGLQNVRETPARSSYLSGTPDDSNSSLPPYLPPVLEEPNSSFSEAAEDDPLPAIEGLQINGQAFPGRELQACGYSINGTTSCNFEWVRYLEDGSANYILGAKQPNYLVTADDVDNILAIEVQPLDDRKRKGELVKVFANEQRKITLDPKMQEEIFRSLSIGRASFDVSLLAQYLDIWEPAVLTIKKEGYSIKCSGPRGVVVMEKFVHHTFVGIPYGEPTGFSVLSSCGNEYILRAVGDSSLRDTIVLTLRLFQTRAIEKKGKKKGLFFSSFV